MNVLIAVLRAAHCRSTHHYFAIDALPLVQTDAGRRLASHLLYHHRRYLSGAKDPDTRFRDFQNHVVHVTDGYWGGAPRVAHQWYDRLQRYLRTDRFGDAAHAAGVLSHYFTDPMQPLHTEQCDREKVLHRPIEWSITKSYNEIFRHWQRDDLRIVFQLSGETGWLGEAILHGARFANRKYDTLLDQYDLQRGAKNPPEGLNDRLRASLAEMFGLSITGLARLLERAAADAEAVRRKPLPTAKLILPTLLASMRTPVRWWTRRIADRRQRATVRRIVDEFQQTGDLVQNLPAEIDIVHRVRKIRHDEKRWRNERAARLASNATVVGVQSEAAETQSEAVLLPFRQPATDPTNSLENQPLRFRLAAGDPLVDAPSIGPKTARRFAEIGIASVDQFLRCDPAATADRLATGWISADTISGWQTQARLMCQIPDLLCRDAQMISGAGYTAAAGVAAADPQTLYDRVASFAATSSGQRYLRGGPLPAPQDAVRWQRDAARAIECSQRRLA